MNKQGAMRTRNTNKTGQTPPVKKASKTPVKAELPEAKTVDEPVEIKQDLKANDAAKVVLEANGEGKKADAKGSAKKPKKGGPSKSADAVRNLQEDLEEAVASSTETDRNLPEPALAKEPEAAAEADEHVLSGDEEMEEVEEEGEEEGEEEEGIEGDEVEGEVEDAGEEEDEGEEEEEEDEETGDEDVGEMEEAYLAEEHPELQDLQPVTERQKRKQLEVFIGGLDREATEEDVKKAFDSVGEVVEVRVIKDTQTGKNKGYAFVHFATAEQAAKAADLKRTQIKGKFCAVVPNEDNDALFIGNINKSWKKEQLLEKLKDYGIGDIEELTLLEDNQNEGMNRGYAFLELTTHEDAIKALKLLAKEGTVFGSDKPSRVAWARQSESHEAMMSQVKSVFVDGILPSWTEEKIKELFGKHGEVERVVLARNMPRSKRNDFAFVNYVTRDSAIACIDFLKDNELIDGETKLKVKVRLVKPIPKVRRGKRSFRGGYSSSRFARAGRRRQGVSRGSVIDRKTVGNQRPLSQRRPIGRGKVAAREILPKFMRRRPFDESPERPRIRRPLGASGRSSRLPVRDDLRREVRRGRFGYPGRIAQNYRERDYMRDDRLPPRGSDFPDILPSRRDRQVRQLIPPPRDDWYPRGPERGYDYVAHDYDEPRPAVGRSYGGEHGLRSKRPYSSLEEDIYEPAPRAFPRARVGYDLPPPSQYEPARSPLGRAGISNVTGSGSSLLYGSGKHGYNSLLVGGGDHVSYGAELTGSSLYGSRPTASSGGYGYPGAGSGSYY